MIAQPKKASAQLPARLHSRGDVEVYLDGALLRRTSWHQCEGQWETLVEIPEGPVLEIALTGAISQPPTELAIVRDKP